MGWLGGMVLAAGAALGQPALFYQNDGIVDVQEGYPAPNIDALNFINNNTFNIYLGRGDDGLRSDPFFTTHTLNYTNNGVMNGNFGFLFQTFSPESPIGSQFRWAGNFHNIGLISVAGTTNVVAVTTNFNLVVNEGAKLLVSATNIYSPGTLYAGVDSYISLAGSDVDINNGVVVMEGFTDLSPSNNILGLFDGYWALSTNEAVLGPLLSPPNPATPPHPVTTRGNQNPIVQLILTNAVSYYSEMMDFSGSNRLIRVAYIQNTNAAMDVRVYMPEASIDSFFSLDPIVVEWAWTNAPLFTPEPTPDYLYLVDDLAEPRRDINLFPNGTAGPRTTYIPGNYTFLRGGPRNIFGALPMVPATPPGFPGGVITNLNTAYLALFQPTTVVPSDIAGQNATNLPGRIIFTATNTLAMNFSRIIGPNTIEIASPNQFLGNEGAEIAVPLASLNFRNTNGIITITNLMHPAIPRPEGTIALWSCRWTNVTQNITNIFHVLFVDSRFAPNSPGRIQDLTLSATNLFIHDVLNITRYFIFDGQAVTIASNAPSARTPTGGISLLSPSIIWSTATPRLSYLTNLGTIATLNAVYFGGNRRWPYYNDNFNEPYEAFVNRGTVIDEGTLIWSKYFEHGGEFRSSSGSFSLESVNAIMTNAAVNTPAGDVSIASGSLYISNTVLNAGRRINLAITNSMEDGGLTNGNVWVVGTGVSSVPGLTLRRPNPLAAVNLLGTTITNISPPRANNQINWEGYDYGPIANAFTNNGAIGRLILDAKDSYSKFTFAPVSGTNALYVDYIELRNWATNYDGSLNFTALEVLPGMKVYYAQAVDENGQPLAVRLNGLNDGRLVWVGAYAGFFSSTNFVYPNGTTNLVNYALVTSCDLDTDNDGIPNCNDPDPAPPSYFWGVSTNLVPPGTGGNGGSTNPPPGGGTILPALAYPGMVSPSVTAPQNFLEVKGVYYGLFYNSDAVDAASSGYLGVAPAANGSYSAVIRTLGRSYAFSGRFDAQGRATKVIPRPGLGTLTVTLQLDAARADMTRDDQIRGQISGPGWTAEVLANRLVYSAYRRCPYAGRYNLVIPPDATVTNGPAGYGYGLVDVDIYGYATLTAYLADGTKVTQRTGISADGIWPLYAAPYSGRGLALGWVEMSTNLMGGQLIWVKPAVAASRYYPAGFTNWTEVAGSRYQRRPAGTPVIPLANGSGQLIFSGDFLSAPFTNVIFLSGNNRVVSSQPGLSMTVSPLSGWFYGTTVNPETGKGLPFQGMLLQEGNFGAGFNWTTNRYGGVVLLPSP